MSTTTKKAAKKKPRPPNDRDQGRKTIDPGGEVMKKRNIRATDAHWTTQKKRGYEVWRDWLGLSDAEFASYLDWYAKLVRKREREQRAAA